MDAERLKLSVCWYHLFSNKELLSNHIVHLGRRWCCEGNLNTQLLR